MAATVKFRDFSNYLISGASSSGKSQFARNLLLEKDRLFVTPPSKIVVTYKHWQSFYDELQKRMPQQLEFIDRVPTEAELEEMTRGHKHSIYLADDMASEVATNPFFLDLLTRVGHHVGVSAVIIVQDAALGGKNKSALLKNFHVNIFMTAPRERQVIKSLGILLDDYKALVSSYDHATAVKYGYLCVDTHPAAETDYRYRSGLFEHDGPVIIYRSRKKKKEEDA